MSDTQHVSLDFIASQLQRLLAELREMKTTLDLDRRNAIARLTIIWPLKWPAQSGISMQNWNSQSRILMTDSINWSN
jgi:hypothetical protein